jgi:YVTN family beta-propeller protein
MIKVRSFVLIPIAFVFFLLQCATAEKQSPRIPTPDEKDYAYFQKSLSGKPSLEKIQEVETEYYPKQICFHPTRPEVYVTNLGNHEKAPFSKGSLQIFSLNEGKLLHREAVTAAVECLVDEKNPNLLYYTDMFRDEVVKFNISSRSVIWRTKIKPSNIKDFAGHEYRYMPKIVHKDYDSERLYISLWLNGASVIDDKKGELITQIPKFCSLPRGLLFRDGILHVMCYGIGGSGIGEIVWLDPEKEKVVKRIQTGGSPRHIIPYGKDKALISNLNSAQIYLYDIKTGTIEKKIHAGSANTIVLDPGGRYLYVSDRTRNKLIIIDVELWKTVDSIDVGKFPTGLAVSPDGKYIAISNFHDMTYSLYRIKRE